MRACHCQSPASKVARSEAGRLSPDQESLRSDARQPRWSQRWSRSRLQVIDPKASAASSWSGMMPATTARSPSDPLDGYCMLTAVVDGSSEHRLSTAVRGDIPSTMHELAMSIAAVHRYACASSVQTRGSCSIKRQSVATAHRRVRLWCQEARRALSCDDNDRYRSTLATSCSC